MSISQVLFLFCVAYSGVASTTTTTTTTSTLSILSIMSTTTTTTTTSTADTENYRSASNKNPGPKSKHGSGFESETCNGSNSCTFESEFDNHEPEKHKSEHIELPEKSSLVTLSDGTVLIVPVVESEFPELVKYFDIGVFYERLYRILFRCANCRRIKPYREDYSLTTDNNMHRQTKISNDEAQMIIRLIKMKCDEFTSGIHPLSKELLKNEASKN